MSQPVKGLTEAASLERFGPRSFFAAKLRLV